MAPVPKSLRTWLLEAAAAIDLLQGLLDRHPDPAEVCAAVRGALGYPDERLGGGPWDRIVTCQAMWAFIGPYLGDRYGASLDRLGEAVDRALARPERRAAS